MSTRIAIDYYRKLESKERIEVFEQEFTDQELEDALTQALRYFKNTLGKKKTQIFEESVIPYLENSREIRIKDANKYLFDLSLVQRWIFWKVFDLGWTSEYFCDLGLGRENSGRRSNKAERISKKYQWLAYHELLARVSDNFHFESDDCNQNDKLGYQGSWQNYFRDIDPSCLLKDIPRKKLDNNYVSWWSLPKYDAWDSTPDNIEWLKSDIDLPPIKQMIEIVNPRDNSQWLTLENYRSWTEPIPVDEDRYDYPKRDIWYMVKSYIVHQEDIDCLYDWACKQDFMGRWMPESNENSNIFLGEYFWSRAFEYHNIPYFSHDGWTKGRDKRIPKPVFVSTDKYFTETGTYDCSVDDSFYIYMPCSLLAKKMDLRWNGIEGSFFDDHNNLIAFDPSVTELGSNGCLIKREALLKFLNENNYDILWTFLAEKMVFNSFRHLHYGTRKFNGAFRLKNGNLVSEINTELVLRDNN